MATITKLDRPTGVVYKARARKAGRGEFTKTFKHRSDAEKWARKEEAVIERDDSGLSGEAARHTLSDAIQRYLAECLPRPMLPAPKRPIALTWRTGTRSWDI